MGYDEKSQTLRVQFRTNAVYDYLGVPEEAYKMLKMSQSIGTSLRSLIKGVYQFRKVIEG